MIKGNVLFDDVRFMPGPLADQLLSVFQKEQKPLAVLRDPISVRITGRKVYQEGLVIPVANLAWIGLDGSVDFDSNLDLVARFSLNPPRADVPVITTILETARLEIPIRGTLQNPKIDGEAMKDRWKAIGTDLLEGSMKAGLNGLQQLLQGLPAKPFGGLFPPGRPRALPPPPRVVAPDGPKLPTAEERSSSATSGAANDSKRKRPAASSEACHRNRSPHRSDRLSGHAGIPPVPGLAAAAWISPTITLGQLTETMVLALLIVGVTDTFGPAPGLAFGLHVGDGACWAT